MLHSTDMDFDCLFIDFNFQFTSSPWFTFQKTIQKIYVVTVDALWLHHRKADDDFIKKKKKHFPPSQESMASLCFSLLLNFEFFAENSSDLASHERPRYGRVGERTFLSWRAIHFSTGSLKEKVMLSFKFTEAMTIFLTCRLMLSRLHGKQNLWWATDGHWTKWVSSNRSWQIVPARGARGLVSLW